MSENDRPIITPIQRAENKGLFCPVCRSTDHDYASTDYDAPYFSQKVKCLECGASWVNVYRLAGYEELVIRVKPGFERPTLVTYKFP